MLIIAKTQVGCPIHLYLDDERLSIAVAAQQVALRQPGSGSGIAWIRESDDWQGISIGPGHGGAGGCSGIMLIVWRCMRQPPIFYGCLETWSHWPQLAYLALNPP